MKSRQLDEGGQQTSLDELNAIDLTMNKVTGDVAGSGPGSLTHVGRGSGQAALGRPAAPDQKAARADNDLTYLNVQFRTFLDGNLNRRMTRFGGRCYSSRTGNSYVSQRPSKRKIQAICRRISEWTELRWCWLDVEEQVVRLNQMLVGWANYFCQGPRKGDGRDTEHDADAQADGQRREDARLSDST